MGVGEGVGLGWGVGDGVSLGSGVGCDVGDGASVLVGLRVGWVAPASVTGSGCGWGERRAGPFGGRLGARRQPVAECDNPLRGGPGPGKRFAARSPSSTSLPEAGL